MAEVRQCRCAADLVRQEGQLVIDLLVDWQPM